MVGLAAVVAMAFLLAAELIRRIVCLIAAHIAWANRMQDDCAKQRVHGGVLSYAERKKLAIEAPPEHKLQSGAAASNFR